MTSQIDTKVVKNYAQALFEVSLAQGAVDDMVKACNLVLHYMVGSPALRQVFHNPLLSEEDQKKILKHFIPKQVLHFFFFIIQKKKLSFIEEISALFIEKVRNHNQHLLVSVEVAFLLTDAQKDHLCDKLCAMMKVKKVFLEEKINPYLLGGMRLTIGNNLLDASLSTKAVGLLKGKNV